MRKPADLKRVAARIASVRTAGQDPLATLDEVCGILEELIKDFHKVVDELPEGEPRKADTKSRLQDLISGLEVPVYKPLKRVTDQLNNKYDVKPKAGHKDEGV
jgi:hypothetical protein